VGVGVDVCVVCVRVRVGGGWVSLGVAVLFILFAAVCCSMLHT